MKKSLIFVFISVLIFGGTVLADEVSAEEDLNASIKDFMKPFARKEYAGGIDPQFLIEKSNDIIRNIYSDILKIKDRYKELQEFGEKGYKEGRPVAYKTKCWGYCPPWELAEIKFCIHINFSEFPYNNGTDSFSPSMQIYIEEIRHYLKLYGAANNQLTNEVANIIKENLKDYTTKDTF